MPFENRVRRLSLDPINLEVELEAVVLGVLLQDIVEGRLHDPAPGLLGGRHGNPHDRSAPKGWKNDYRQPRLQLPLVSYLSCDLLTLTSSSSSPPHLFKISD